MKRNEIKNKIKLFLSRYLQDSNIEDDEKLFTSGLVNSLFAMQLVLFIENEFNMIIENDDLDLNNFDTVDAITRLIKTKISH